jgi:hypothetical protein
VFSLSQVKRGCSTKDVDMKVPLISIIVSIGFLVASIYKIWKLVEVTRRKSASSMWPVIVGEVVSKRITKTMSAKGVTTYFPEITYKYSVMGMPFQKETLMGGMFSKKSAEKAINNIQNTIELRYNPQNPKEHITVLDKINVWDIGLIIVTLVLAIYLMEPLFL